MRAREHTAVIFPCAFLVAFALGQISLALVFHARDTLHASRLTIGLLPASWSVAYVLGCFAIRPWFATWPPRRLLTGVLAVLAIIAPTLALVPGLGGVFALYGIFGAVLALFWPTLMGWLSQGVEGPALGRRMTRYNISWTLGNTLSPFIAGWLIEWRARIPLHLAGLLLGAGALWMAFAPGIVAPSHTGAVDATPSAVPPVDGSTRLRYPAWVALFANYFILGLVIAVFPLAAREEWGLRQGVIGELLLIQALFSGVAFIGLGGWHGWHFKRWPGLLPPLVGALCCLCLSATRAALPAGAVLAVYGLAFALAYNNSFFHGVSGSADRAHRMAIHEGVLAAGIVSGALLGGLCFERAGGAAAWRLGAGLSLATTGAVALLLAGRRDGARRHV